MKPIPRDRLKPALNRLPNRLRRLKSGHGIDIGLVDKTGATLFGGPVDFLVDCSLSRQ
jgi:hypothetical protein